MYVWSGYLTCRHHWPWRPSSLYQPTVLGPSKLGCSLTPQILPLTVSLPETWTGANLPAAKGDKKEEIGDGQGLAASRILSSPPQKVQALPCLHRYYGPSLVKGVWRVSRMVGPVGILVGGLGPCSMGLGQGLSLLD